MPKDFTISIYKELLEAFVAGGYSFQTYRDFIQSPKERVVILRHDVDDRNSHSFLFAEIQQSMGIQGTYYFRVVPESYHPEMMRTMQSMGHEIGLHYEEMDFAKGNIDAAYGLFLQHLKMFREVVNVDTICMHGSPKSSFDNKEIWRHYAYQDLGLIGEPYFDLNLDEVFYLTDTGMMWDGNKYSIRDKMSSERFNCSFHSTQEIILSLRKGLFPNQCMMNFHPQRWHSDNQKWREEKLKQSLKNIVKRILLLFRNRK